jgi:hypothetical protein
LDENREFNSTVFLCIFLKTWFFLERKTASFYMVIFVQQNAGTFWENESFA